MKDKVRFLGLDVHAETIAVAIAEPDGSVHNLGTIANRAESIRKMIKKLGPVEQLKACYEAGPAGYVLYWQLAELGVACEVIAPTLMPMKAGDRVKTDRRDAERLARSYRSGDLTAVWVPDEESEALRDLVRAREATMLDYLHEVDHMAARVKRLEQAITEAVKLAAPAVREVVKGLQALRGVAEISAVMIVAELGSITRFDTPRQLMGYSGAVPSENSSGKRTQRGSITKTGNAHLRRIAVEAAWSYRLRPGIGPALRKRQEGVPEPIKEIAWKAQIRLTKRYARLVAAGKDQRKIVTAVGRELLAFIWAIGVEAEAAGELRTAA